MEDYPPEYVGHDLPLLFVSGISSAVSQGDEQPSERLETGTRLTRKSPLCRSDRADLFLTNLVDCDGGKKAWNASSLPGPNSSMSYKIKPVGGTFTLPPRKAAPLALPTAPDPSPTTQPPSGALHSPLSPLSPGSPVFPDGVLTPFWFQKHQDQVPSLLLLCFDISTAGSIADIREIQTDITNVRSTLTRSGFKTRFAAVLLSDRSILEAPELEEGLAAIRRSTSLDSKTGLFFLPPNATSSEMSTFVQSLLTAVQPSVVDYYRDLTKHARRKKTRSNTGSGILPSAGGGSQALSTSGWNIRYDVKQGVFAEFRQEMDGAERHYSAAVEEFFKDDGVLETTPSWAPRWNHARLLCDALALRVIRCQLWLNLTSGATESWLNYQARMKSLIDRRGKGSETYAWAAWEARWAIAMSQLVHRTQPPTLRTSIEMTPNLTWFPAWAKPEKPVDRLTPIQHLHHAGYWLMLAISKLRRRRQRALAIPETDRIPPSQIPASAAASRNRNYDLYLALHPHEEIPLPGEKGYDHLDQITEFSKKAIDLMKSRGQFRLAYELELRLGQDFAGVERWADALAICKSLLRESRWDKDGWNSLHVWMLDLTLKCALFEKDAETVLVTSWQRMRDFAPHTKSMDVTSCLDNIQIPSGKLEMTMDAKHTKGPVSISLAFADSQGHVGEFLECQLSLISHAHTSTAPITFSRINIQLSGHSAISIHHSPTQSDVKSAIMLHELSSAQPPETGYNDLSSSLHIAPRQTHVYRFFTQFRGPGTVIAECVSLYLETAKFSIRQDFASSHISNSPYLFTQNDSKLHRKLLVRTDNTNVVILPKPPKLDIVLPGAKRYLFTHENARIPVTFTNEESVNINGRVRAILNGRSKEPLLLNWEVQSNQQPESAPLEMTTGQSYTIVLLLTGSPEPGGYPLEIQAEYSLASDPQTMLVKVQETELEFQEPFEAKFEFGPQHHRAPWPSFFQCAAEDEGRAYEGIIHSWQLGCQITSVTLETLNIERLALVCDMTPDATQCEMSTPPTEELLSFSNQEVRKVDFCFTTQKLSLDDRRPSMIELSLEMLWRRAEETISSRTMIPVPRLTLPSSEPRVLLTASHEGSEGVELVLEYHLENPSLHFLTFTVAMDASDEFAFSGPKFRQLSLAPLSRYLLQYDIFVHNKNSMGEGVRQIRPSLQVWDSYYQKNLKTHPGGPNVHSDEDGIVVDLPRISEG